MRGRSKNLVENYTLSCKLALDDFNAKEHEIKQSVTIEDSSKHKKIHQTLIPGLMYRGKVLKVAQVSVYCFKN